MERALGAARAEALVGRTPAASTSAVTCAASPRAFQGACRACARRRAIGESAMTGGKLERQSRADVLRALERNRAAVIADHAMRDGEADAGMSDLGAHERFEGAREHFGRDG